MESGRTNVTSRARLPETAAALPASRFASDFGTWLQGFLSRSVKRALVRSNTDKAWLTDGFPVQPKGVWVQGRITHRAKRALQIAAAPKAPVLLHTSC